MNRLKYTLDTAIEAVYLNYTEILKKKHIENKEQLRQKLLLYAASIGIEDLESYVKKLSLDKFITLMLKMVIDPQFLAAQFQLQTPVVDSEEKVQEKKRLRIEITKFIRKYLGEILPKEKKHGQMELETWESDNSEDIREMLDNIIENFGGKSIALGLDIDHLSIQAYHDVLEDEWKI